MTQRVFLLTGTLVAFALPAFWPTTPGVGPAQAAPPPGAAAAALAGTASCSGRACHGGLDPQAAPGAQQNEYSTWLSWDKHAGAYHVLFNERSQRMAKHLGIKAAHEEVRCLACHSTPQALHDPGSPLHREERSQGVGCEACHGGAERWLGPHTSAAWKQQSAAAKAQMGMVPLGDLTVRVETCAGCHVGAPAKDGLPARNMNHDMIAAGHPQLHFEIGTFIANLPKHWRGAAEGPDFEARQWAVGQVGTAGAALELLAHRAGTKELPWPEFAEFNCFACHHNLRDDATERWRQRRGYGKRAPGSLPWGEWYTALLPALAKQQAPAGGGILSSLEELAQTMSRTRPDRQKVAEAARAGAGQMRKWAEALAASKYDRTALRRLLRSSAEGTGPLADWEVGEQLYLAYYTWSGPDDRKPHQKALSELEQRRAFPVGQDSPAGDFRADQLLASLRDLLKQLPE
jgi:hypothetical protein